MGERGDMPTRARFVGKKVGISSVNFFVKEYFFVIYLTTSYPDALGELGVVRHLLLENPRGVGVHLPRQLSHELLVERAAVGVHVANPVVGSGSPSYGGGSHHRSRVVAVAPALAPHSGVA